MKIDQAPEKKIAIAIEEITSQDQATIGMMTDDEIEKGNEKEIMTTMIETAIETEIDIVIETAIGIVIETGIEIEKETATEIEKETATETIEIGIEIVIVTSEGGMTKGAVMMTKNAPDAMLLRAEATILPVFPPRGCFPIFESASFPLDMAMLSIKKRE